MNFAKDILFATGFEELRHQYFLEPFFSERLDNYIVLKFNKALFKNFGDHNKNNNYLIPKGQQPK